MVLGNMDVGISTQNLMAILLVIFLSVVNIFGVKTGAAIQNVFTVAKVSALLGLAVFGFFLGRNAVALTVNFGANFWHNAGLSAQHAVQVGVGGPIVMVGTLTILAVAQVGSLFSADAWNNVTFTAGEVKNPSRNLPISLALGTGVVISNGSASSLTEASPDIRCARMARRVGSARAAKVAESWSDPIRI